jgi:hypothetical protein
MNWKAFSTELGFFAFYSLLGFCFICVPVEVIGSALDLSLETVIIAMLLITTYSAVLL